MLVVALEGLDACGKTEQAKLLASRLNARTFAFPDYSTKTGAFIRGYLQGDNPKDDALVFQSLMTINRLEKQADLVDAMSYSGVVLDRYTASALVYGALDGVDPKWIDDLNSQLRVQPDLNILLDISSEESFARRPDRRDRYERDRDRMDRARMEYLRLFVERAEEGAYERWVVVDGSGTIEQVAERIWDVVRS